MTDAKYEILVKSQLMIHIHVHDEKIQHSESVSCIKNDVLCQDKIPNSAHIFS